MKAVWDERLNVGVPELDEQHKQLTEIVYQMRAMIGHFDRDAFSQLFSDFVAATRAHFHAEECYMQQHRYPGFAVHKHEHDVLLSKAGEVVEQFATKRIDSLESTIEFFRSWLKSHILDSDMQYALYLATAQTTPQTSCV